MIDWKEISKEASFVSHRLIGWIYWDPDAIRAYSDLGIPDGFGYYVTTRAGKLGNAAPKIVSAAYYSIHPEFVNASYQMLNKHSTLNDAMKVRDEAVSDGLKKFVPEICDELASMRELLWESAESLPISGRVLFASQLDHRRLDNPLIDAWLAVNCIREWRGDTHWAMLTAEDITGVQAGILDGARRSYDADWLPRSRGADDEAIRTAYTGLEKRGLAKNQVVTDAGIAYRQSLEDKLNEITSLAWKNIGEEATQNFVRLVNSVGEVLLERIDVTGGTKWMPAARRLTVPEE
ncbi:MAG: hypothetical protein CL431_09665 [Acidimicrobiaceae bacterium]|nr:hypothetical protein [Acidimicrobiaceae bacterium]